MSWVECGAEDSPGFPGEHNGRARCYVKHRRVRGVKHAPGLVTDAVSSSAVGWLRILRGVGRRRGGGEEPWLRYWVLPGLSLGAHTVRCGTSTVK